MGEEIFEDMHGERDFLDSFIVPSIDVLSVAMSKFIYNNLSVNEWHRMSLPIIILALVMR